jgi:hypothetical protein
MKKTATQPKTETKKSLFALKVKDLKMIHGGAGVIIGGGQRP